MQKKAWSCKTLCSSKLFTPTCKYPSYPWHFASLLAIATIWPPTSLYLSRRAVTPGWTTLTHFLALTMFWSTAWSPSSMWVVSKSKFSSNRARLFFIFCLSWSVKVTIEFTYFTDSSLSWILVHHELPASEDIGQKKEEPRKGKPRPTLLSGGQGAAKASWYRDGVIWPLVWNLDIELIQEQYWLNKFAMKLKWNLPDQNTL